MNSVIVITLCNVLNGACLSMPMQTELTTIECPDVVSTFNTEQRKKTHLDSVRTIASCVPENEFPMEYFNIKQASYDNQ